MDRAVGPYTQGMESMNHDRFEQCMADAFGEIPEPVRKRIENVAFVIEDDPRQARRTEHEIKANGTLLGLYQGIPLPDRSRYYSGALPDKITLFKNAIEATAGPSPSNICRLIRSVLHHEVAHYLGMDESAVRAWEKRRPAKTNVSKKTKNTLK